MYMANPVPLSPRHFSGFLTNMTEKHLSNNPEDLSADIAYIVAIAMCESLSYGVFGLDNVRDFYDRLSAVMKENAKKASLSTDVKKQACAPYYERVADLALLAKEGNQADKQTLSETAVA